jgi:hypothetical protein
MKQPRNSNPYGSRYQGRPLKKLLDEWGQNGSTNRPTPWLLDDDDDDDETSINLCYTNSRQTILINEGNKVHCPVPAYRLDISHIPALREDGSLLILRERVRGVPIWPVDPRDDLRTHGWREVDQVSHCREQNTCCPAVPGHLNEHTRLCNMIFRLLFNDAFGIGIMQRRMAGWQSNNELEEIL